MGYDAFISYSHSADLDLAPAVREGLQRLAKPWNKRRALSVFLDQSSLELSSELGGSLDERIKDTRWLVLFMSEKSAQSRWVGEEISEWAEKKSKEQLALVLTSGDVVWDDDAKDFDYKRSTAVSEGMRGVFTGQDSEPLFLDLRWTKDLTEGEKSLDLTNLKFRDAIATLAAPVHGIPKDQLEGEDIRQFKLARRLRRAAVTGLAVLFMLAVVAAVIARIQRNFSEARRLAAVSEANAAEQTDVAHLLALESLLVKETEEGWSALFESLSRPILARSPMTGHRDSVKRVAFSPDGSLVASAGDDSTVRLWDVRSGQQVGEPLVGHTGLVEGLAFGPSGRWLASGDSDGTILLWDTASPPTIDKTLKGHKFIVSALAFHPDGTRLASGGFDGSVRLWDLGSPEELWQRPGSGPLEPSQEAHVLAVAFSPDGSRLASAASNGEVRGWNLAGDLVDEPELADATGWGRGMAFSPDLSRLAVADRENTVRLWDLASGRAGGPLVGHGDRVWSLEFSSDGQQLASASLDRTVRLWDVEAGRALGEPMTGHDGEVYGVAFSQDGSLLASASFDKDVRLWDLDSGYQVGKRLTGQANLEAVALDPRGLVAASGDGNGGVWLWDVRSGRGEPLGNHAGGVLSLAFSPNGSLLATGGGDGAARLWHVASRQPRVGPLAGHDEVTALAFDADGSLLATAGFDGTLRIWGVDSGRLLVGPLAHDNPVLALAFSHDGRFLASAGFGGTVRVWPLDTAAAAPRLFAGHDEVVWALAFPPQEPRLLSVGSDGTVRRWNLDSGEQEGEALLSDWGRDEWIRTAAFSQDGALLATTARDATIQLWDVPGGRPIGELLRGHGEGLAAIGFSRNGALLASVSEDDSLRLWPAQAAWPALACEATGRNLSAAEWRSLVDPTAGDYRRHCAAHKPGADAPRGARGAKYSSLGLGWPVPSRR